MPPASSQPQIENDPAIVTDLIKNSQASIEELKQSIETKSGSDVLDFIFRRYSAIKENIISPAKYGCHYGRYECFIMDQ